MGLRQAFKVCGLESKISHNFEEKRKKGTASERGNHS